MIHKVEITQMAADRLLVIDSLTSAYATECRKLGYAVESVKLTARTGAEISIKQPGIDIAEVEKFEDEFAGSPIQGKFDFFAKSNEKGDAR